MWDIAAEDVVGCSLHISATYSLEQRNKIGCRRLGVPAENGTLRKLFVDHLGGRDVGEQHKLFYQRIGLELLLALNVHWVVRLTVQAKADLARVKCAGRGDEHRKACEDEPTGPSGARMPTSGLASSSAPRSMRAFVRHLAILFSTRSP